MLIFKKLIHNTSVQGVKWNCYRMFDVWLSTCFIWATWSNVDLLL